MGKGFFPHRHPFFGIFKPLLRLDKDSRQWRCQLPTVPPTQSFDYVIGYGLNPQMAFDNWLLSIDQEIAEKYRVLLKQVRQAGLATRHFDLATLYPSDQTYSYPANSVIGNYPSHA
jgi:hypothetical protein